MKRLRFQIQNVVLGTLNPSPAAMKVLKAIANSPKHFSGDSAGVEAVARGGGGDGGDLGSFRTHGSAPKAALPTVLQPRVVVYDGVCHLCHRGVKWVIRADKYEKIKFCCLQSKAAEPYLNLCGVDREDVLRRFIFIEGLGQYHQASTAALKVMSYLPFPYSALSSLLVIPTPVRDVVYDYVAKRRYDWFGKEERCLVSREPELLERFIDREEILERCQSSS